MIHIGIDIGGTFTDFAVWNGDSRGYVGVSTHKVPSSPPAFADAVRDGLEHILAEHRVERDARVMIVHGTTVGTNTVITRSGPPMALLTTKGFRDLLNLARLRLDKPVDIFNRRASPLVPRSHVFEIDERILADGSIDRPIDLGTVDAAVAKASADGVQTICICFLHAFRRPEHERAAAERVRALAPEMDVVTSHEVWPQESEYERAVVTLINGYVRKTMDDYIGSIERFLAERLPNASLLITRSNGGSMSAHDARRLPVHTMLSGPAAGVTAACYLARALDLPDVLTMDMGGTSTDISLIRNGLATTSTESRVGNFPLIMPVTAIEALGAGGGSIIWMDGPVLKVGPSSASAVPGPACYGKGGVTPTLTDAYLLCGYLNPAGLLGGRLALKREQAEHAFDPIVERMGGNALSVAESSIRIATATMLANVLPFLARLGVNPTDLTLVIYGGAGGIHGPLLADEVGISKVVVPRTPSVFCAFGCLVSDLRHDTVRSVHGMNTSSKALQAIFHELRNEAHDWLATQTRGNLPGRIDHEYQVDMRYVGQSFQVTVAVEQHAALAGDMQVLADAFHQEHDRLFGHNDRSAPVELIDLRLSIIGRVDAPVANAMPDSRTASPAEEPPTRQVRFTGGRTLLTPVIDIATLPADAVIVGPAIFERSDSTIVLPPGFTARVGKYGDILMTRGA